MTGRAGSSPDGTTRGHVNVAARKPRSRAGNFSRTASPSNTSVTGATAEGRPPEAA